MKPRLAHVILLGHHENKADTITECRNFVILSMSIYVVFIDAVYYCVWLILVIILQLGQARANLCAGPY